MPTDRLDFDALLARAVPTDDSGLVLDAGPVDITPAIARTLWARRVNRRPLEPDHVANCAAIMRAGMWRTNSELTLDKHGRLTDGQHRMRAVIDSGRTVRFRVLIIPEVSMAEAYAMGDILGALLQQATAAATGTAWEAARPGRSATRRLR